jgi:hypothetical protein
MTLAGWIAGDNRAGGNVVDNQGACAHEGTRADFNSAHYDCAAANRRTFPDDSILQLPVAFLLRSPVGDGRTRITIIDEDHAVTDEYLVLYGHSGADEGVTRYFAALADGGITLDFDEGAKTAIVTNHTAVQIDEGRQSHPFAEPNVISDTTELRMRLFDGRRAHRSAFPSGTIKPPLRNDQLAASRTLTTRNPLTPSVSGVLPVRIQLTK